MAKLAKPTTGKWYGIMGMVETDNDDVPDVACCDPRTFDQGDHLFYDENTVRANAALMAESKDMRTLLKLCLRRLDFGLEHDELAYRIERTIAKTQVEYMPNFSYPGAGDMIAAQLGQPAPGLTPDPK